MRPLWLRLAGGFVALGAAAGGLVLVWTTLFWLYWSLTPVLAALVVVAVSPLAAWPLFAGRWADGSWGVLQQTALVVSAGAYALVALAADAKALHAVTTREEYATPAMECAGWLALAAGAALVIATLAATAPMELPDAALASLIGVLGLAGLGSAGAAVAIAAGPSSCERFEFSRAAWERDPTPVAEGLVRCRTLVGMSEREVQRVLGGRLGRTSWHAGSVDDGFFGADARLSVRYAGRHVRSTRLDYVHR
ncbi:hypothetical protein DVA67_004910 [Solirubrobacter sp. CPCC 204708]|uniref:Uncharacterized protein n=1 Tax=Solirubrobacter deserti TaxID=2282478 RepID=A0ABT4RHI2_9ACTN|nr:hypothetical protein [Solirubrobacter deserti]MBE2315303.1 hypothetical protein [Solirubrobacter deserti]MDA0137988.1 hypothetical protein [Solirubrobacter deserti]